MFIKWGEAGPLTTPQSEPGTGGNWLPCVIADLTNYNPETQSISYRCESNIVYQVITGTAELTYAQARYREYPSIRDQLDAIWKGGDAMEAMRQNILEIKNKYPKPDNLG